MKNGNVVVLRDGDTVRSILYKEFYPDLGEFLEEVIGFLNTRKLGRPNISFMEVADEHLTFCSDDEFATEFKDFMKMLGKDVHTCPKCGNSLFVYLDEEKSYCHKCKTDFDH